MAYNIDILNIIKFNITYMTKYIISSGKSVVTELLDNQNISGVKLTNLINDALMFDTIGAAMKKAVIVNNILGTSISHLLTVHV